MKASGLLYSMLYVPYSLEKLLLCTLWVIMGFIALAYMYKYALGSFIYMKVIESSLIKSQNRKASDKHKEYLF